MDDALSPDDAAAFAARWLPAWTGGDPEPLLAFYTDDVSYSDPSVPDGLEGKEAFRRYLTWLLGNNPDWVWTHERGVPLEGGFLNHWRADVPVGDEVVVCRGVCSVQLRDGLIRANHVFFDTHPLVTAIQAHLASR